MGDGVLGLESWGWGQSGVVPPQSERGLDSLNKFFGKDFGRTVFVRPRVAGWWRNKT